MARIKTKRKEYLKNDFSDYVRCEMRKKHITQEKMAERLGVERTTFTKMLSNQTFTLDYIIDIFDELETSEEQIGRLMKL